MVTVAVVVVKVIRCCVYIYIVMVYCSCHRNVCLRTQGFCVTCDHLLLDL